jgi:hypothetical protein
VKLTSGGRLASRVALAILFAETLAGCSSEPAPADSGVGAAAGVGASGGAGGSGHAGATAAGAGSGSGGAMSGSGGTGALAGSGGTSAGTAGTSPGGASGQAGGAGSGAGAGAGGMLGGAGQGGGSAGTTAGAAGGGGAESSSGGAAGSGGVTAGGAAGSGGGSGAGTTCASGAYAICEDFEATADGAVPAGWTKVGSVGTASDMAHRGSKALKVGAAANGPRRMQLTGSRVTMLGGMHWGRIFYKMQTPAPRPSSGVIHSTIVAWDSMSPISGTAEVRVVDTVENTQGQHQYLYNVQTSNRGEFGKGSPYDFSYDGAWYCAEWTVDFATQRYRFFLDGTEITSIGIMNGAGNFQNSELPSAYTALSIGWNNYQEAPSPGFVAWIDDVVIASERVGCD